MITLETTKQHLRVLHDQDDGLIQSMINAAMAYVDTQVDEWPSEATAIEAATLLLVADLYENRSRQEITGQGGFRENDAFRLLLNPYRSMEVCS